MKRTFILFAMLAMAFSFSEAGAQSIRSMIRNKIIEDQLDAQAKRDSVKAVEAGEEPDPTPNTTMDRVYMDALGLTGNVDYEPSYDFDAYIQMEVSSYKKNEKLKDKMLYDTYIHKEAVDYAMVFSDKDDRSTIIFDAGNSAMLVLSDSDGEKSGFAMAMDPEDVKEMIEEHEDESDTTPYEIHKTGKTRTILGYVCDEYLVENEDSEASMWVSEKLGKQVRREMLNNQQTFGAMFYYASNLNGMVLEYNLLDKDNGERTVMQVTEVDLNRSHTISTRNYNVISIKGQSTGE